jgi:hypothetical protein
LVSDALNVEPSNKVTDSFDALLSLGYDRHIVESLTSVLISLASLGLSGDHSSNEIVEAIFDDLAAQDGTWFTKDLHDERREMFTRLLAPERVAHLAAKAILINSADDGLVLSSKILTETRWIFSDSADKVIGAITRHSLFITHSNGVGNEDSSVFVLDDEDLLKLKIQVERAVTKASALYSLTEATSTPNLRT